MTNIGRPSVWDQHGERMEQMYSQEQLSRGDIARYFNTSVQTVTRVLTRRGVEFEERMSSSPVTRTAEEQAAINAKVSAAKTGKGTGPRRAPEVRTCENRSCNRQFEYRVGKTGERFCSRSCRNDYAAFVNKEAAKDAYELDPKRCPCGTAIPFEYRHTRQFCSPEHRSEYQAKRQPNPSNYVTFNCLNCGKEVTRLKNYSVTQKYCSNECSAKHNRTRKFYAVEDLEIIFESSYECLFWSLCSFWKIPCERADRSMAVQPIDDGWYCPDFYLPGLNIWVEVKGFEDDDDRIRYEAWRKAGRGRKLAVVRREELNSLRDASRDAQFAARLNLLADGRLQEVEPW